MSSTDSTIRTDTGIRNDTGTRNDAPRPPLTAMRKTALIAGVLYLMTFVFSIPVKFWLWKDALDDHNFILGSGSGGGVRLGAVFELITALAGIGTAVALYSVARRHSERAALGFVTSLVIEASVIFVGVLSVLTVFTLRSDVAGTAGADPAALLTTGRALIAIHNWTFLIGPGLMAAVNAFCIASVMHRSKLVPRVIARIGLVGAPLLLASCVATLFGAFKQVSGPAFVLGLPIFVWELSFGWWMTFKGFTAPEEMVPSTATEPLTLAAV
jgi:hypothetical protein